MAEKKVIKSKKRRDFYVTYLGADKAKAEWMALTLEEAGYSVLIQAREFNAGEGFLSKMNDGDQKCKKNLLILSRKYFMSPLWKEEWAGEFEDDPEGEKGKLLPVRMHDFDVKGALGAVPYVDLVGLDRHGAKAVLLEAARKRRARFPSEL